MQQLVTIPCFVIFCWPFIYTRKDLCATVCLPEPFKRCYIAVIHAYFCPNKIVTISNSCPYPAIRICLRCPGIMQWRGFYSLFRNILLAIKSVVFGTVRSNPVQTYFAYNLSHSKGVPAIFLHILSFLIK